ncbi:hypothetical protein ACWEOH_06780 [Agromyces sp. NPDC004153]
MIARLLRNPAAIALALVVVVAAALTIWAVGVVVEDTGEIFLNPDPSDAAIAQYRIIQIANAIPQPATLVGVVALLGFIIVGAVTNRVIDAEHDRRRSSTIDGR